MNYYLKLFLLVCIPIIAFSVIAEEKMGVLNPDAHFFHQSFNDLKDELEIAKESGKKGILIMFNDKDCPWCEKMKSTVMNQVSVQEFYQHNFRVLTVDTRGNNIMVNFDGNELMEKDFSFKKHRVRATPVFIFFDLTGKPVVRYTGATRNVDEFQWLGEFAASGAYKFTHYTKYKREKLARVNK